MIKDSEIENAIKKIAKLNIGFSFEVSGILNIRELDSGEYAVGFDLFEQEQWEKVFWSLDDAIECFLSTRKSHELGEDFEQARENIQFGEEDVEFYSFTNADPDELWLVPILDGAKYPVQVEPTESDLYQAKLHNQDQSSPAIDYKRAEFIIKRLIEYINAGSYDLGNIYFTYCDEAGFKTREM